MNAAVIEQNEEAAGELRALLALCCLGGADAFRSIGEIAPSQGKAYQLIIIGPSAEQQGWTFQIIVEARKLNPEAALVVISPAWQKDRAVRALQLGAFDFLDWRYLKQRLPEAVSAALSRPIDTTAALQAFKAEFVTECPSSRRVVEDLARYARQGQCDILILGETGTGKEVCARLIHLQSDRKKQPFVALNSSAFPEELVESELFGHEQGAFTGAARKRRGAFGRTESGTLFLDEIGELKLTVQARLLRVLDQRTFTPVGADAESKFLGRILYATNRDLKKMVNNGEFREDLYQRIAAHQILIPALRERKEDIIPLANYFIRRHGKEPYPQLSAQAKEFLLDHPYEGNVRQLENFIRDALTRVTGPEILPRHLPASQMFLQSDQADSFDFPERLFSLPWKEAMEIVERAFNKEYMPRLSKATGGSTKQAEILSGLTAKPLRQKRKEAEQGPSSQE